MEKEVPEFAPKIIKEGIVSVRLTERGRGSALRTFVNTIDMCYADSCLGKYSTVPTESRKTPWCDHLKEGVKASTHAQEIKVKVQQLKDLNLDTATVDLVESYCVDENISIFKVNNNVMAVPTFGQDFGLGMIHVKELECKLKKCRSVKLPHALAKRTKKICIHNLLVLVSGWFLSEKPLPLVTHKIDHVKSVEILVEKIQNNFPSMDDEELSEFLPKCQPFLQNIR